MVKRRFHRLSLIHLVTLVPVLSISSLLIWAEQASDKAMRAQNMVVQMRKAVYGDAKAESIQGISLSWKTRIQRPNGDQDSGETEIDLLLPDKMIKKQMLMLAGNIGQITTYDLLNGERSWSDTYSSSSETPVMKIGGEDLTKRLQARRKEQARQFLYLMLPPSPDFPLAFTYAGEAEASDGRADVIDVQGPNDFSARLFVDKITSRLLMMTYKEGILTRLSYKPGSEKIDLGEKARAEAVKWIEAKIRFSDYKPEGSVTLPHLLTYEREGKIVMEQSLKSFRLNPAFPHDHFDPGKKRK